MFAHATDHQDEMRGHHYDDQSALQQHVEFFDQDRNGIVYPWETYAGKYKS